MNWNKGSLYLVVLFLVLAAASPVFASHHGGMNVVWNPPVSLDKTVQYQSTLPIKFELHDDYHHLIQEMRDVFLMIHPGVCGDWGPGFARYDLGDGLAFRGHQYMAHFRPSHYAVEPGWYVAVVHRGDTGAAIGCVPFYVKK
jgi:hypothetical protein